MSDMSLKIIRVPISTPTLLPFTSTNCYLIGNDQESILVDAGFDQEETRNDLEKAIVENGLAIPKSIILTHYHLDHAPGIKQLLDWKPKVYTHQLERENTLNAVFPFKELNFFKDEDVITVAGREVMILHCPGHTAGHLNLYIPSEQVLISGDNMVGEGTSWIGPPDGDMIHYIQTLHRFKTMKLTKIGPGHGDWILNPYEQIDFVLNRRLFREEQILSLLKEHNYTSPAALTELIYQDTIHPSVLKVAIRTTEAHLIKLVKEGKVFLQDSLYYIKN